MKGKRQLKDPESVAAMEIVAMEQRQDAMAEATKGAREKATSILFREAGSVETLNFTRNQAKFLMLIKLKRVKEAKEYRDKLDMTWAKFCESVGVSHITVDKQLAELKGLKTEFLVSFTNFAGFDFSKIKYLAEERLVQSTKIQDNLIIYNGQEIAILPENKDEIQAVLEKIESDYKQQLEDAHSDAKAAKKIARAKEEVIAKQEKDLRKFEKRAEGRGLSPEEDAFEQQIENFRIAFDGYMTRIEPTRMEELQNDGRRMTDERREDEATSAVTPRMRAMYLEVLGYMRRQVVAAYDTATEMYGADMAAPGETWTPK